MNGPGRIAELERQLHWAHLEIQALREELRQRRIQQLGPKSETLSNLQLALLTDNLAENSMRPVAVGRKNWLHVGSAQAGPKVAAILSAVESCRRLGVPVKDYLAAVLPGLNRRTLSQVSNLTPARWSTARS